MLIPKQKHELIAKAVKEEYSRLQNLESELSEDELLKSGEKIISVLFSPISSPEKPIIPQKQ